MSIEGHNRFDGFASKIASEACRFVVWDSIGESQSLLIQLAQHIRRMLQWSVKATCKCFIAYIITRNGISLARHAYRVAKMIVLVTSWCFVG